MTSPGRGELPLLDYDHLPVGTLHHRIRALSPEQIQQLVEYENQHAQRIPVLEMLDQRLEQLAAGEEPSEGNQETRPEQPPAPNTGSPVSPDSAGPPAGAPPHGIPDQSGKPKGDYQPWAGLSPGHG